MRTRHISTQEKKIRSFDPRKNRHETNPSLFQAFIEMKNTALSEKKGRKGDVGFNERSINRSSITIRRPLQDKQAVLLRKRGWMR